MADFKATAISGSLTRVLSGETYLIGGANIDITTGSDDRVTITGTGGGGSSEWTRAAGDLHSTTNPTTTDVLIGNTAEATANTILKADGSAVFNEQHAAVDFRVESDNLQGAILVDGGTEQIILGTNSTTAAGESVPIGTDIRLLLSGTIGSRGGNSKGATLFSGDAIASGSLTVHNSGKSGGTISGSIHHTEDGISYLVGSGLVTVTSGANGQITISATGDGTAEWTRNGNNLYPNTPTATSVYIGDTDTGSHDIVFGADGSAIFNQQGSAVDFRVETDLKENALLVKGASNQILIHSGGAAASPHEAGGTDVAFYVSGTQGSQGTSTRGTSLFGGDTVVSGAIHGNGREKLPDSFDVTGSIFVDGDNSSKGIAKAIVWGSEGGKQAPQASIGVTENGLRLGLSGSNGINLRIPKGNAKWISHIATNGGDTAQNYFLLGLGSTTTNILNFGRDDVDTQILDTSSGKVAFQVKATPGQVLIHSGGAEASTDESSGNDVAFYVSGTQGSQGTSTRGTSLFGGDTVISGALRVMGGTPSPSNKYLTGSIFIDHLGGRRDGAIVWGETVDSGVSFRSAIYVTNTGDLTLSSSNKINQSVRFGEGSIIQATTGDEIVSQRNIYLQKDPDSTKSGHSRNIINYGNGNVDSIFNSYSRANAFVVLASSSNRYGAGTNGGASTGQVLVMSGGAASSADCKEMADTVFFVSGTIGSRGTIVRGISTFGGDVVASGSLTVSNTGRAGGTISGSIHHTEDGISYLVGSGLVTVTSASNGQVIISATGDGSSEWTDNSGVLHPKDSSGEQDVVIGGTTIGNARIHLLKEGGAIFNQQAESSGATTFIVFGSTLSRELVTAIPGDSQVLLLSGGAGTGNSPNEKNYTDMAFFVSGAIGSRGTSTKGTSIFGGDVVTSGSLTVKNSGKNGGTISGSIHHTEDGLSYLIGGSNVIITSASNGQVTINSTGGGTPGGSNTQVQFNDSGAFGGISGATTDGSAITFSDSGILVGQDITHAGGDDDTKITFENDQITFTAGNLQMLTLREHTQDVVRVGGDGGDVDFQVSGSGDTHALFVDTSTGRVGMGTSSPDSILHIKESAPTVTIQRESNSNNSTLQFKGQAGAIATMVHMATTNDLVFSTHDGSDQEEILRLGSHYGSDNRQVIMLSGSAMAASAMQPKESVDINFFVSGAIGSKNTSTKGTAVFGGDLLVSGVLHVEGSSQYQTGKEVGIALNNASSVQRIVWDTIDQGSVFDPDAQIYEEAGDLYLSASSDVRIRAEQGNIHVDMADRLVISEDPGASGKFVEIFGHNGSYQNVLDIGDTGVFINDDAQAQYDFRVESGNKVGMFMVDAGEDIAMLNSIATSKAGESPGVGADVAVFMSGTRDGINAAAPSGGGVVLASGDMFVSGAIYEQDQVLLSMRTVDDADQSTAAGAGNEYAVFIQSLYSAANPFNDVISAQNCAVDTTTGVISVTSLNHNKRYGQFSFMVRLVAPASTGDAFVTIRDNGAAGSILWQTQIKLIGGGNDEKCVAATVILPPNSKPTLTVKGAGGQVVTTKAGSTMTFKNA